MSLESYEEDDLLPFYEFKSSSPNLSVERLVLSELRSQSTVIYLLQLLPNFSHLKVEILYINLDRNLWEQIIVSYLAQLKVLPLKMSVHLSCSIDDQNNEEKVNQYLVTYRTPF